MDFYQIVMKYLQEKGYKQVHGFWQNLRAKRPYFEVSNGTDGAGYKTTTIEICLPGSHISIAIVAGAVSISIPKYDRKKADPDPEALVRKWAEAYRKANNFNGPVLDLYLPDHSTVERI